MKASLAARKATKIINDEKIELSSVLETQNLYLSQNDVAENLLQSSENSTCPDGCVSTTDERKKGYDV